MSDEKTIYDARLALTSERINYVLGEAADEIKAQDAAKLKTLQEDAEIIGMAAQLVTLHKKLKEKGVVVYRNAQTGAADIELFPGTTLTTKFDSVRGEFRRDQLDKAKGDFLEANLPPLSPPTRYALRMDLDRLLRRKGL